MGWIDTWLLPLGGVLLGGVGMVVLVRGLFGRWFRARGRAGWVRSCRRCRFDLSATEGHTCPECGHTARYEAEHYAGRFRWPVAVLGLLLLVGAVGLAMTPGVKRDGWLPKLPMALQVRLYHLENNAAGFIAFTERLEDRTPTTHPGGFHIRFHNEAVSPEVDAWRDAAFRTALHVMSRQSPRNARQIERARVVLTRFSTRLRDLPPDAIERLIDLHGLSDPIPGILASWSGTPTPAIRQARRDIIAADPSQVPMLIPVIASSDPDSQDRQLVAEFLADRGAPAFVGGPTHLISRVQHLRTRPSESIWRLYAEEVRNDRIGNNPTLVDGATSSPAVADAAINYAFRMDRGEPRSSLVESLVTPYISTLPDGFTIDRAVLGALFNEPGDFARHRDLVRLFNHHDSRAAEWYIAHARDPNSPLRHQALVELGSVRHDRGRAFAFWSDEAWSDESLGLHHRMAALFSMRSWDRSDHAELAPFWEQVLQRAADADPLALEQGLPRFTGPGVPPTTDAIIAVARRLAANGTSEDWLVDLAGRMASRWGRDHSLKGLVELLEDRRAWTLADAAWYRNEIESLIAAVKALVPDEPDSPAREP
ncbi:MAG: hypothetical protein LAT64_06285 [Phycisphaerales bacterium]|nr:hypothetical protein [Planctomycetota bacterium]MCH8508363.1 hypothetical protein [Phycisphaerales bacterium]